MEATKERNSAISMVPKLQFEYLPAFGKFMLDNKLDELTRDLLGFARKIEYPLLKYFAHIPEEQLLEISKASNADLLQHMINNTLHEQIYHSNKQWKENQLPVMDKAEIVAKDLTLSGYVRRTVWIKFIKEYSSDIDLCFHILTELDEFQMEADSISFQTFIDMQRGKLDHKNDELRDANQSLEYKNKELERSNKELTSFSYVASHDLQEPLRKIKTYSNMILEDEAGTRSPKASQYFNNIHASAARMQQLITDLLAFSRTHTYDKVQEEVDLNKLIREIGSQYDSKVDDKELILEVGKLPVVKGTAFQFVQLFENIISNAIRYSKPVVPIHIWVSCVEVKGSDLIKQGGEANRNYYRIDIRDNGIGFENEYSNKIFEVFQRLHNRDQYSGTGIGLAICKKIVQNHEGLIYATGTPDVGAVFSVCLPIEGPPNPSRETRDL